MRILLAEDEKDLARAIGAVLTHEGYEICAVQDGRAAVEKAKENHYDCMVFDIMMPVMDGVEALRRIREAGDRTPLLFLTAKSEVADRIEGLDAGADDYLTKPFAMGELLARIRALTRRSENYASPVIAVGDVTLDMSEQELSVRSSIRLSGKEAKVMELFMRNPGICFAPEEILDKVWREETGTGRKLVQLYISYLREKLSALEADIGITERESGYILEKIS